MVNGPFPHPATVAVEHTDLMLLGTPINPHKPLVWHRLSISLGRHGGRYSKAHNFLSSLSRVFFSDDFPWMSLGPVQVLNAQLPTRGIPRLSRSRARPLLALWVQGSRGTASERITTVSLDSIRSQLFFNGTGALGTWRLGRSTALAGGTSLLGQPGGQRDRRGWM